MSGRTPILILLNSLEMGGSQKNAIEFADAVRPHGYQPTLMGWKLAHDSNTAMLDVASARGLEVVVRDRPKHTLPAAQVVDEVARQHGCKLVHSYGWTMFEAFWGPARWGRIPMVSTIYEMLVYPGPPFRSPMIFGTQYQHKAALERRAGDVHLIPPPVDTIHDDPALFPEPARDGIVRLAIISRLAEEMKARGVELAIRVLPQLPSNVRLIVTGDGDAAPRLRSLGESMNAQLGREAVQFNGNAVDARPYYASADVVLGMGGSAARALAFGKPLVALGEHGWSRLFTPDSAEEVSAASYWSKEPVEDAEGCLRSQLLPLIESETYRRELGTFGREFILRTQGLEQMASKLAAIYSSALAKRAHPEWYADAFSTLLSKRAILATKLAEYAASVFRPRIPAR